MKKILLVGCGKLGFRYLQAINNLDFDFECIILEKQIFLKLYIQNQNLNY